MIRFAICEDDQAMADKLERLVETLVPLYDLEFEVSVYRESRL